MLRAPDLSDMTDEQIADRWALGRLFYDSRFSDFSDDEDEWQASITTFKNAIRDMYEAYCETTRAINYEIWEQRRILS